MGILSRENLFIIFKGNIPSKQFHPLVKVDHYYWRGGWWKKTFFSGRETSVRWANWLINYYFWEELILTICIQYLLIVWIKNNLKKSLEKSIFKSYKQIFDQYKLVFTSNELYFANSQFSKFQRQISNFPNKNLFLVFQKLRQSQVFTKLYKIDSPGVENSCKSFLSIFVVWKI